MRVSSYIIVLFLQIPNVLSFSMEMDGLQVSEHLEQDNAPSEGKECEISGLNGALNGESNFEAVVPLVDVSDDDESTSDESEYVFRDVVPAYDFKNHHIVKTADRILDDLRNDPLFLIDGEDGILSKPTIDYSQKLCNKIGRSQLDYQMFHFDPKGKVLHPFKSENLFNGESLWVCDGIIAPLADLSLNEFSKLKTFHYRIKIKTNGSNLCLKNTFHLFKDDELNEGDKKLLVVDRAAIFDSFKVFDEISSGVYTSENLDIAMPTIIDSANYISNETRTIIRIEVYPSLLSESDLEGFTLTEIQTRAVTYNSTAESDFDGEVSTARSFHKFYNSLIGPFKLTDPKIRPDIKLKKTKLEVFLDVELLKRKLLFIASSDVNDIELLTPQYFEDWGNYKSILRDHYQRTLLECQYFLTLFEITEKQKLESNNDKVFELINDSDIINQKQAWMKWNKKFYTSDMILLSSTPYYDLNTVTNMYYNFAADHLNIPIYFDALIGISKSVVIPQLGDVVLSLRKTGSVGFSELKTSFNALGLTNVSHIIDMYNYDPVDILDAYRTQIAVSNTKMEKKNLRDHLKTISVYKRSPEIISFIYTEPFFDIEDAYRLLNVTQDKEDDWILTMYTSNMSDNTMSLTTEYARALLSIAISRRSLNLMNFITENIPQFLNSTMSTEEAFSVLGLYTTADEETIIRVFQNRAATDVNADYKSLWLALKAAGKEKNSDLIVTFMRTGIINSSLLSVERTPAGIENIGNTCYLNSLLQYYFVIKPFREYVLNFDEVFDVSSFENNEVYQMRRIGGRTAGLNETQRSYQFVHKLKELYFAMIHENSRCVIPKRELAFLAFSPIEQVVNITTNVEENDLMDITVNDNDSYAEPIQLESSQEPELIQNETSTLENPVIIGTPDEDDGMIGDDIVEVMDLGDEPEEVSGPVVLTEVKAKATAMISDEDFQFAIEQSGQQDVTECIQNVLSQTETAMIPDNLDEDNEQNDIVKNLFYGKTKQTLTKIDTDTMTEIDDAEKSVKIERFLNLIVSLEDQPKNIYDALDSYFRADLLEYDNESVKRSLTITELPNILQVQIQRVQYDRQLFRPVKNTDPLPFDSTIYMDRFMETDDPNILTKREESFQLRVKLNELKSRLEFLTRRGENGMTVKDSLISAKNFFESSNFKSFDLTVDSNTIEVLNIEIEKIDIELMNLRDDISQTEEKLLHQFDEFKKIGYTVFAAFIHRGSATYGHYWIYIRDPKNNVWRVYNDETVSEVSPEVVFDFSQSNTATPYYLVFVKDDSIDSIEPLKREIIVEQSDNIVIDELD